MSPCDIQDLRRRPGYRWRSARRCRTPSDLPHAGVATDAEVLHFIDAHAPFGRGVGYVDAHLLAAVRLTAAAALWTGDKRLHGVEQLGLAIAPP